MIKELYTLQHTVFEKLNHSISGLQADPECEEYSGYYFQLAHYTIIFRKAKVTPKKNGQFVTLWKRNSKTFQTEPYNTADHFHFHIIYTELNEKSGFFIFPKDILIQQQILSTKRKEGKRGFRVYPEWDAPQNKQAEKTKAWQNMFFIDFSHKDLLRKYEKILTFKV